MFKKGLKDVVAVQTNIASVKGDIGELRYRGVLVDELIPSHSFEEVAYFIWYGLLPNESERRNMESKLMNGRHLPLHVQKILDALPAEVPIMDALRTAISAYVHEGFSNEPIEEQAIILTAVFPVIIARHYRNQQGLPPINPDPNLSHIANYLWMLNGKLPKHQQVEALETYLKLTMEHGLNAATFSARVTISTESDLTAAVTSAIGTMKGPLHGGAPSGVIELLEEIGNQENIISVIKEKLQNGEKIMGFGHRIYKTEDPRSILLRNKCTSMSGKDEWLDLATVAEKEIIDLLEHHKPDRKLYTNVEYYAAAIMRSIEMPPELFTPTFSVARIIGWTAHAIEQLQDNAIFRPQSEYIGCERKLREHEMN
ncbi:citrate synthase/methylcitrate synthase [Bacillus sp. S/N-304-OC-R1]|uniref:citrate synthase/methylcitrate synthase n=1 Tax=Bacillus sp. S/N-304-OC-R1 TaxID=2758034 RepID=UPI001C8EDA9E|nr:citrate synthase/methylcitrate synthase [Bacillus sp. S/N-304-OC-R1]MBY0121646.1 citrate synthase/methylcitrate synthase [Bacillus sp. S/N-304-OC-R1]